MKHLISCDNINNFSLKEENDILVNTSETTTPTITNGKNLLTIGSKTTEKWINSNEKQLSIITTEKWNKSTKPTASVGSGIQTVPKKKN